MEMRGVQYGHEFKLHRPPGGWPGSETGSRHRYWNLGETVREARDTFLS